MSPTVTPLDAAWLARWRADITTALDAVIPTFETTHGYPPGTNEIRAARDIGQQLPGYGDLLTFYRSVGEVVLPDIGNGFFVHPLHDVLRRLAEEGPVRIPGTDGLHGVVFASDGGGVLYVADRSGAVHRSRTSSLDDAEFDQVADDLPHFLERVRRSVVRFAATGCPQDV